MVGAASRHATYEDVLAVPPEQVAQIMDGELIVQPRPAVPHAVATSALAEELGPPFKRGRGGPVGWLILFEPEVHLARDILVPDLAGWRRSRLPEVPSEAFFTLAPDWSCEVLSPGTEKLDRGRKLRIYAREGVAHAWLVNPLERTLEVLRREGTAWLTVAVHSDADCVRGEPFEAFELDPSVLWMEAVG